MTAVAGGQQHNGQQKRHACKAEGNVCKLQDAQSSVLPSKGGGQRTQQGRLCPGPCLQAACCRTPALLLMTAGDEPHWGVGSLIVNAHVECYEHLTLQRDNACCSMHCLHSCHEALQLEDCWRGGIRAEGRPLAFIMHGCLPGSMRATAVLRTQLASEAAPVRACPLPAAVAGLLCAGWFWQRPARTPAAPAILALWLQPVRQCCLQGTELQVSQTGNTNARLAQAAPRHTHEWLSQGHEGDLQV